MFLTTDKMSQKQRESCKFAFSNSVKMKNLIEDIEVLSPASGEAS
jgi:hypothetical protein